MVLLTVLLAASSQVAVGWTPDSSPKVAEIVRGLQIPVTRVGNPAEDFATWSWHRSELPDSEELEVLSVLIERVKMPRDQAIDRLRSTLQAASGTGRSEARFPSNLPIGFEALLHLGNGVNPLVRVAGPRSYFEVYITAHKPEESAVTPQEREELHKLSERLSRWCLAEYEGSLLTATGAGWITAEGERHFPARVWAESKDFACTTDADGICRIAAPGGRLLLAAGSSAAIYAGDKIVLPSIIYARDGEILIPESVAARFTSSS